MSAERAPVKGARIYTIEVTMKDGARYSIGLKYDSDWEPDEWWIESGFFGTYPRGPARRPELMKNRLFLEAPRPGPDGEELEVAMDFFDYSPIPARDDAGDGVHACKCGIALGRFTWVVKGWD